MAVWNAIVGILGIALLVLGGAVLVAPDVLPAIQLAAVQQADGVAEVKTTYQAITAGPLLFDRTQIEVHYPSRIREDETLTVTARASQFASAVDLGPRDPNAPMSTDPPSGAGEHRALVWPIALALSGAAFDIDPRERTYPKGAALPLDISWTAFPKSTGTHTLILDWSGIAPPEFGWRPESGVGAVLVNGNPYDDTLNRHQIWLSVAVVTKWGITQFWADVIGGVLSFTGFVAGLPLVGWLWRRFSAKSGSGAAS